MTALWLLPDTAVHRELADATERVAAALLEWEAAWNAGMTAPVESQATARELEATTFNRWKSAEISHAKLTAQLGDKP